jgi:peptide methionine sulfoxide reductase MsrA
MVSLGKPVQSPSFAKTLSRDYDPFNKQIVPSAPVAPIKTRKSKLSPFISLYDEKLFHIEFIHKNITNPLLLIKYYFPAHPTDGAQQHFNPNDQYKTIQYYQNILQQEGSIIIKGIYDQFHDKKLLYHKI